MNIFYNNFLFFRSKIGAVQRNWTPNKSLDPKPKFKDPWPDALKPKVPTDPDPKKSDVKKMSVEQSNTILAPLLKERTIEEYIPIYRKWLEDYDKLLTEHSKEMKEYELKRDRFDEEIHEKYYRQMKLRSMKFMTTPDYNKKIDAVQKWSKDSTKRANMHRLNLEQRKAEAAYRAAVREKEEELVEAEEKEKKRIDDELQDAIAKIRKYNEDAEKAKAEAEKAKAEAEKAKAEAAKKAGK